MNFSILFKNDVITIAPELFLCVGIMFLMVYGVILNSSKSHGYPIIMKNVLLLSIFLLLISICLIFNNFFNFGTIVNGVLVHDFLTNTFKIIILSSGVLCFFISKDYIWSSGWRSYEYFLLILFSLLGLCLLVSSYDLISFYLAIELQSLSFYVLAAYQRNSAFSTEAGLKYFVLGAVSSGLLLFGSSLIYGFSGATSFEVFSRLFAENFISYSNYDYLLLILGLIMLICGLMFKLTAAPFHVWAPDVYEGAPMPTTAFFSIVPKIAIFALLIRILFTSFSDFVSFWQIILIICALASMIFGAFGALQQKWIKRLLVFSSIGHVGYMLIGLSSGTLQGLESLFIYLLIYVISSMNIWTIVLSLKDNSGYNRYITDLSSLGEKNPILAITLTLCLFSMAGVPPLAGFYAKFYVFFSAIESSVYILAFIGVITSVIGSFYYIRLIKIMYFEKPKVWRSFHKIDYVKSIILGLTFLFILCFFVYPVPLYLLAHKLALTLVI